MDKRSDRRCFMLLYTPGVGAYWVIGSSVLLFDLQQYFFEVGGVSEVLEVLPNMAMSDWKKRDTMRSRWEKYMRVLEQEEANHG